MLQARHYEFDVERAIYLSVLHGFLPAAAIGAENVGEKTISFRGPKRPINLHHLYRAMAFLSQEVEPRGQKTLGTSRCLKDLIEEELFERRRDLLSRLRLQYSILH